ncbi:MAG: hypothetical protein ACOYOV_06355 [Bacteroidales bacterium]
MKITKLWKVCDSKIIPVFGTPKELCELIKQQGYYTSKVDANLELRYKIINNKPTVCN